jgi:hypothetical protein
MAKGESVMALPSNRPDSDQVVETDLADVAEESSAFAAATMRGCIHKIFGVLQDNTVGTSLVSLKINGTTIDGVSLAVGGIVGTTFMSDENASPSRGWVEEGDTIEFVSDGGSAGAAGLHLAAVIAKM